MKFTAGLLLALAVVTLRAASPGPALLLPWSRIAAGGGTSSGGGFALGGTIGQHEATAPIAGGGFVLSSGFWSYLTVVQTPGAPTLSIQLTPDNAAVISWPAPATGFILQASEDLSPGSWATATDSITDSAGLRSVRIASPAGHRSYRLVHP